MTVQGAQHGATSCCPSPSSSFFCGSSVKSVLETELGLSIGYLWLGANALAFGTIGASAVSVKDVFVSEMKESRCTALASETLRLFVPTAALYSLETSLVILDISKRSLRRLKASDGASSGRCCRAFKPCNYRKFCFLLEERITSKREKKKTHTHTTLTSIHFCASSAESA